MSGHPHKGKRTEWFSCGNPPRLDGTYEYVGLFAREVALLQWSEGSFIVHDKKESTVFWPLHGLGRWRGLAEKLG